MINTIKNLLGIGQKTDFAGLVKQGAVIVDVRTKAEFQQGHIKGSQNIPLNTLPGHYNKLSKDKIIITCCASGIRSAQAKQLLKANGYKEVHNGGGWNSLQNRIKN